MFKKFLEKFYKKEKIGNTRIVTILGKKYTYDRNKFRASKIAFSAKIKNAKLMGANKISKNAVISADKESEVVIHEGTDIGIATTIKAINGAHITIGKNCRIGRNNNIISCQHDIEIQDNVLMASQIGFFTGNHCYQDISTPIMYQPGIGAKITIKKDSWIANNVMILTGVTIGEHSVIGGGSVVTKSIPDYCVAAGNPCRVIKKYNFETQQWERVNS